MNAIPSVRAQPSPFFTPPMQSCLRQHKSSVMSFSKQPEIMDEKDENPKEKSADIMADSFGEGYATRSEEEGFGGIYGCQNQGLKTDKNIPGPETDPAYDKTQGSEVKEKEKARHQTHV